jgi:acetyl-CoA C-acetyltransferase
MSDDHTPVIAGIGEIADRPADPVQALEPLALMQAALERADEDAGGGLLTALDSLDLVNLVSWRYADPARQLAERMGIAPRRAVYGPVGGESPIRYLHEAALRIARGESEVAAIAGAEAQSAAAKAGKAGIELPWTPLRLDGPPSIRGVNFCHPLAVRLGAAQPTTVYPFYDAASAESWGQTPREALAESGDLWAAYARVAASNPTAWLRHAFSRDEIITPTADNRPIAWPYTKLMVANPMVNQGAALLVTSLARARQAGIPDHRLIHVWGGAAANEPRDYLDRDHYRDSHAQNAVLERAIAIAGGDGFDALELYSCFPCVPKMARRRLGLGADVQPSVTGGLTFFGAPLNNYMTHAACAMVRRLREGRGIGLLYGQGEFVTKHHGLVLSAEAPKRPIQSWDPSVQDDADRRRGPVPPVVEGAAGSAILETFTVIFDRDGAPSQGVVILRLPDGARTMARVPAQDEATLAWLLSLDQSPIGSFGILKSSADGISDWRVPS